jgi:hypothetical protein
MQRKLATSPSADQRGRLNYSPYFGFETMGFSTFFIGREHHDVIFYYFGILFCSETIILFV